MKERYDNLDGLRAYAAIGAVGTMKKSKMEKLILNISISVVIKDSGRSLQSYVLLL
jgi:hypothetical protein